MAITVEQFAKRLPSVVRLVNARIPGFLLVAGKRLEGLQKQRIFNDGKASDGSQIGEYSESYSKFRQNFRSSRQVDYVDLQLTGDLFKNFQVLKDGDDIVLAIPNDKDYFKATINEEKFGKIIFEPTEGEERDVEKDFERNIEQAIERIFLNL